jgi:predicted DCC family thiol-disulfide oxidoreductase YuxK
VSDIKYPPNVTESDCVILFDGICKFCNAWSKFIIKYDKQQLFKLCFVQSTEGQKILRHFNLQTERFDTMLYVEGYKSFDKSDAFFNIIYKLGLPWRLFYILKILPKRMRNWLYDRIAINRYYLFGKYDICTLPTTKNENRFLKNKTLSYISQHHQTNTTSSLNSNKPD